MTYVGIDVSKATFVVAYSSARTGRTKTFKNTVRGVHEFIQTISAAEHHCVLEATGLKTGVTLAELICRPELTYETIADIDLERMPLPDDVVEQVEIEIKYEGYIERQLKQVEHYKKMEKKKIPADLDYNEVGSLRLEARQKLIAYKPVSVGQASRISGVSPADISVLLVYLESSRKKTDR